MKFSLMTDWLTDFGHDQFKQFSSRPGITLSFWGTGLFFLCLLSWKILLAIATGIAITWVIYEAQSPNNRLREKGQSILNSARQTPMGLASLSGVIAALTVLFAFWLSSVTGRGWITATLLLQGLSCCGIFGIWRSLVRRKANTLIPASPHLDRYIGDLAHPNPMRRLIAVRRLQNQMMHYRFPLRQQRELNDYFQMLLSQEVNPLIRVALQDALETTHGTQTYPALLEAKPASDLVLKPRQKRTYINQKSELSVH